MSSAHPLAALLTGHFDAIMERERTNRSSVHLYGAGDYWVAFEQSAYQLCQLMPSCETTLFRFAVYPFPVVMVSVTDAQLQSFVRLHILRTDQPAYKVFSVRPYSAAATGRGTRRWSVVLPLPRSGRPEPKGSSDKQTDKTR